MLTMTSVQLQTHNGFLFDLIFQKKKTGTKTLLASCSTKILVVMLIISLFFNAEFSLERCSNQRSGAVSESRGGRPELPLPPYAISLMVSVDVKHHERRRMENRPSGGQPDSGGGGGRYL